jgi:hypothetical protein
MSKTKDLKKNDKTSGDKAIKVVDPINNEFEVLSFNYGKATNIIKFKESSFNYCLKELGPIARIIKDARRPIPDPIPAPANANAFNNTHDPFGSLKAAYLRRVSNREDFINELSLKEPQLFAHLWNNISKESRIQIERIQQQSMNFEGELEYLDRDGNVTLANDDGAIRKMEVWDHIFGKDVLSLVRRINTTHLARILV